MTVRLSHPVHALALGFGAGLSPRAPGTAGTLAGVVLYLLMARAALPIYLVITVTLFAIGVWICGRTARDAGVHDHPAIVFDEMIGYLITMAGAPLSLPWMAAGFVLFRVFDIFKPWPISVLDQRVKGGFGIMLDDLLAGVFALVALQLGGLLWRSLV